MADYTMVSYLLVTPSRKRNRMYGGTTELRDPLREVNWIPSISIIQWVGIKSSPIWRRRVTVSPFSQRPGVSFPRFTPLRSRPFYLPTYPLGSLLFTVVLVTPFRASFEGPCPSQSWFSTVTAGRALPRMLLSFPMEENRHLTVRLIFTGFCKLVKTLPYSSRVPRLDEIRARRVSFVSYRLFHRYEIRGSK